MGNEAVVACFMCYLTIYLDLLVYNLFNYAASKADIVASIEWRVMNRRGCTRKWSWSDARFNHTTYLEIPKKTTNFLSQKRLH